MIPSVWFSSTKPGSRPIWRRSGAGARAASASSRAFLTATGRRQPLWPRCAAAGSKRHASFDGPINSARFLAYVEQCLIPTLRPGHIVSLDNLGSHKSKAVRDAIRAAGAKRIFLPAYSPDLNPIEQVFAKLKHLMRKAGERTIDATWNRLGTSLDHFSPQECANYFRNAGYAS